jgi:hypothetical protein
MHVQHLAQTGASLASLPVPPPGTVLPHQPRFLKRQLDEGVRTLDPMVLAQVFVKVLRVPEILTTPFPETLTI